MKDCLKKVVSSTRADTPMFSRDVRFFVELALLVRKLVGITDFSAERGELFVFLESY